MDLRRLLLLASLCTIPGLARADVVGPDPTDCPLGTRGTSCHGMEYCALRPCSTASECATGEICQSRDLCITSGTCGGRLEPDAGPPPPVTVVLGECSGTCGGGSCEPRMVCVPDGTPPGTGSGCGCRVSGAEGTWLGLGAALVVGVAFALRRRGG